MFILKNPVNPVYFFLFWADGTLTDVRILITGASGSGTTTLGLALAARLGVKCFDADDYYWLPTNPPFKHKREPALRLSLLLSDLSIAKSAVLSGSVVRWGVEIEDSFSAIVFLTLPAPIRVARLREREIARFGRVDDEFLNWAAQYDQGTMSGRSLAIHERWLSQRTCPIIRIDGDLTVEERIARIPKECLI
jgi:adenylate kinase family enzyme